MTKNAPKIPLDTYIDQFLEHVSLKGNKRIIFSGKYGTGKSYFLNEFFESAEVNSKYYPLIISPVNYVVSNSEDVFDLIKADIIKHLFIDEHLKFDDSDATLPFHTVAKKYAKKKPLHLLANISRCLSGVSKFAEASTKTADAVIKLLEEFQKFEEELNKQHKSTDQHLLDFLREVTEEKMGYIEHNIITELISTTLQKLKTDSNKKNILVIEDLDRLDPAHIFRILNVLSAHHLDDSNIKFGFDKIMLVCDLENIQKIYWHLYGQETDFSGYINKFYSIKPFYFDNRKLIQEHISSVVQFNLSEGAMALITELISQFIFQKKITLRTLFQAKFKPTFSSKQITLKKENQNDYILDNVAFIQSKEIVTYTKDIEFLFIYKIIENLFGSIEAAYSYMNSSDTPSVTIDQLSNSNFTPFIALSAHILDNLNGFEKLAFRNFDQRNISSPNAKFYSKQYQVKWKWTNENPYKKGDSFLENVTLTVIDSLHQPDSLNTRELFNQMLHMIRKVQAHNLIN